MKWSLWGLGMGLWGSPELTRVHPSPSLPGAFSNLCIQAAEGLAGPCLTLDRWEWGTPSDPRETQRVGGGIRDARQIPAEGHMAPLPIMSRPPLV